MRKTISSGQKFAADAAVAANADANDDADVDSDVCALTVPNLLYVKTQRQTQTQTAKHTDTATATDTAATADTDTNATADCFHLSPPQIAKTIHFAMSSHLLHLLLLLSFLPSSKLYALHFICKRNKQQKQVKTVLSC